MATNQIDEYIKNIVFAPRYSRRICFIKINLRFAVIIHQTVNAITHGEATFWLKDQGHHNVFICVDKLNEKSELFILLTLCSIEYLTLKCIECLVLIYLLQRRSYKNVVSLNDLSRQLPDSWPPQFRTRSLYLILIPLFLSSLV